MYSEIADTETHSTAIEEQLDGTVSEQGIIMTATAVTLLVVGIDFSGMSPQQHQELTTVKITNMALDENYRRFRSLRRHIAEAATEMRADWQVVKQAKHSRLKGPLGTIAHYLTHLDSDNQSVNQPTTEDKA